MEQPKEKEKEAERSCHNCANKHKDKYLICAIVKIPIPSCPFWERVEED